MSAINEKIVTLKFNNGIEVIGQIEQVDEQFVAVKHVVQLVQVPQQHQIGIGFAPLSISGISSEEPIGIPISSLMFFPIETNADFKQKYLEFVTGIALPSTSIITG